MQDHHRRQGQRAARTRRASVHASFPETENLKTIKKAGHPDRPGHPARREPDRHPAQQVHGAAQGRPRSRPRCGPARPTSRWAAFTGQTNVGHWVRNPAVAARLQGLLGAPRHRSRRPDKATPGAARSKKKAASGPRSRRSAPCRRRSRTIPQGVTAVFSPRTGTRRARPLRRSWSTRPTRRPCITLAFGVNKLFKEQLEGQHQPERASSSCCWRRRTSRARTARRPFVAINASNNVYKAWGSFIQDPVYQWARETNARALRLQQARELHPLEVPADGSA